jgi:hypothetical protein
LSRTTVIQPTHLQMGDHVVINNQELTVKFVDAPDRLGTCDLYGVDQQGREQHVFVTGLVTIVV